MKCSFCSAPLGELKTAKRWRKCDKCAKELFKHYGKKRAEKRKQRKLKGLKVDSIKTRLKTSLYRISLRERRKEFLVNLMGGSCMDCGFTGPTECFHFDHKQPELKKANVGTLLVISEKKLLEEVAKCDLVCANCHAIRTKKLIHKWGHHKILQAQADSSLRLKAVTT